MQKIGKALIINRFKLKK